MKETARQAVDKGSAPADALKSWMMVALTASFTLLYSAAIVGWLKPVTDERLVARLEPIIFVIIGYYFGRLPAQQTEKTLKEEISRQTQKADATQHAKEQIQQAREALEEKIKNVRATLASSANASSSAMGKVNQDARDSLKQPKEAIQGEALSQAVTAALSILNT
jgi:uncharacterized protein YlxW (UPF0749 family)